MSAKADTFCSLKNGLQPHRWKIFIVEDEKEIRKELTVLLTKYGFTCESSDDFVDIADHILTTQPDLVLLDINLPYRDGYEVCREVRKRSEVPIIVLTSRNTDFDELPGTALPCRS